MPERRPVPVCYPVWAHWRAADPHMAAIRHIRRTCADDPEREAALIGTVFDQMQAEMRTRMLDARAAAGEVRHA